jgi:LysM repeat protein
MSVIQARSPRRRGGAVRFVAPLAIAALLAAIAVVVVTSPASSGTRGGSHRVSGHSVPPYWIVRPGDTLAQISQKTGVTLEQLEAYNPYINPYALNPGQRLNLWQHPPPPAPPPPKPLGPEFWTVKSGQSFGSIAAQTGINLSKLEQLNPRLKPTSLQPGDRVRLRH